MAGLGVWGSGGLVERKSKGQGRTKRAKGTNKRRKREQKSGNGERKPQKSVQKVFRGSHCDQKYKICTVLAIFSTLESPSGHRIGAPRAPWDPQKELLGATGDIGESQYDQKYHIFLVFAILGAVRVGFGSILGAFPSNLGTHVWYD